MLPVICYCLTLYTLTSAYILYTALHTFSKELTRRICLTIKSFFVIDHFLYSCILNVWFRGETVRGDIRFYSLFEVKELTPRNYMEM